MACKVNLAHAAFADLFLQRILPQLPDRFDAAAQASYDRAEDDDPGQCYQQQGCKHPEGNLDGTQRAVCFCYVDLRYDTKIPVR